jgi:ketosteroid isomerase-like protein
VIGLLVYSANLSLNEQALASPLAQERLEKQEVLSRAEVDARARAWIEQGWTHPTHGAPFDFERQLSSFYEQGPDLLLHDNADPAMRVVVSAADYASIWNELIPPLRSLNNRLLAEPDILVSGDLAVSTLRFESRFELADGSVRQVPTLATLVWRRTGDGWRIIREHGSALVGADHD